MLYNYGTCVIYFKTGMDWAYTSAQDGVILTEYLGKNSDVVVPATIHINDTLIVKDHGLITDDVTAIQNAGSVGDSTLTRKLNAGYIN